MAPHGSLAAAEGSRLGNFIAVRAQIRQAIIGQQVDQGSVVRLDCRPSIEDGDSIAADEQPIVAPRNEFSFEFLARPLPPPAT